MSKGLSTGFVWKGTNFFCAAPTTLNIIRIIATSVVYFKLVKDCKTRYNGDRHGRPRF